MHGKKFSGPTERDATSTSLDQAPPTSTDRFRTNAYPTMTIDGHGPRRTWRGRSAASRPGTRTRTTATRASWSRASTDVTTWTTPQPVDNDRPGRAPDHAVADVRRRQADARRTTTSAKTSSERLLQVDRRDDCAVSLRLHGQPSAGTSAATRWTCAPSMATPGAAPVVRPVRAGCRTTWSAPAGTGRTPVEQLQFNPPNLPMFKQGTVPFCGDYIDLAPSPAFVPACSGGWAFNTSARHAAVPRRLDRQPRRASPPADGNWANYTPPSTAAGPQSIVDPTPDWCRSACAGHDGHAQPEHLHRAHHGRAHRGVARQHQAARARRCSGRSSVFAQNTTYLRQDVQADDREPAAGRPRVVLPVRRCRPTTPHRRRR